MTRLNGSRGNGRQLATTLIIWYPAIRRGYNIFCFDKFASPCLAWSVEISPRRSKEEKNHLNESKMLENRKRLYRSVERMIAYFFYSRVARNRVLPNRAQKGKDFSRTKKDPCSSHAETTHKELARAQPLSVFHLASSLNFFPSLSLSPFHYSRSRASPRACLLSG